MTISKHSFLASVQFSSVALPVWLFVTPWTAACQASLFITIPRAYWNSCPSSGNAIQPSHPLSSPSPPTFNPSQHQGLFKWVSSSHQVAQVLEFQLQHPYSNEYAGLISFRMDLLDLLAAQGTLKNLLQQHSSKASILRCSAFFIVQLSHPLIGKAIALARWMFVGKVMSLLFNMMSSLVITLLPRSKFLLTSWLQSLSAVILEHGNIKSVTVSLLQVMT